jgi:hypothetical protein
MFVDIVTWELKKLRSSHLALFIHQPGLKRNRGKCTGTVEATVSGAFWLPGGVKL